jgi:hypothetical protein
LRRNSLFLLSGNPRIGKQNGGAPDGLRVFPASARGPD